MSPNENLSSSGNFDCLLSEKRIQFTMNENELTSNERSKRLQERQAIELAEDAKGGGGS